MHDEYFWHAVVNTMGIWVISTIPQLVLALVIAHVLNRSLRVRTFFRMSILLPQVTSLVAVALIFTQLFGYRYGLVNYVLNQVGIENVNWEAGRSRRGSRSRPWSRGAGWATTRCSTWRRCSRSRTSSYEASAVDGARTWRQFIHVTIPMRPTIIFTVIISTIGGLQLFTEPFLFQPVQAVPAARPASTRPSRCTCTRRRSAGRSSTSATRRRSRGASSSSSPSSRSSTTCSCAGSDRRTHERDALPHPDAWAKAAPRRRPPRRPAHVLLLVLVTVLDLPLYWSFVVASHDNSALGAYPPVLTPGGNFRDNVHRLFNAGIVNVDFAKALDQLGDRRQRRHGLGRLLQRARRVRVRQARLPRPQALRRRDRDADRARAAGRDPALHPDGPLRLDQPHKR